VRAARLAQRDRQLATMGQLILARSDSIPGRARMLSILLIFEALCDCVADGDAKVLGVADEEVASLLDEGLRQILR
jgi:hypothetical protein